MSPSLIAFLTAFVITGAPGIAMLAFVGFQMWRDRRAARRYQSRRRA
jgi:threonine/homoserine/homoserine lactone efflux protein